MGGEARALLQQAVPAQTEDVQIGNLPAEVADQLGAVEITRGFAAGEEEPGHRSWQRRQYRLGGVPSRRGLSFGRDIARAGPAPVTP